MCEMPGSIDTVHVNAAKALPGVTDVLTAADFKAAGLNNSLGGAMDAEFWQETLVAEKTVLTDDLKLCSEANL